MVDQWQREASRHVEETLAQSDDWHFVYDRKVAQLAAAWAREQALEEAAKVCADLMISGGDNASYCWGAGDCEKAIRALKEKSNEHAPIPG
jgi:hypothetical protein